MSRVEVRQLEGSNAAQRSCVFFNSSSPLAQRDTAFWEAPSACCVVGKAGAVPACTECLRPLGDLALHVRAQTCGSVTRVESLARFAAETSQPEECTWRCGARFCCTHCRDTACGAWHGLLCPARAQEAGESEAHPLREWGIHAASCNDLYCLAGRLLCSSLAAAAAADDVDAEVAVQAARLARLVERGGGQPLWVVVSSATHPDDVPSRKRLRSALKDQVLESYTLLETGLMHTHQQLRGSSALGALLNAAIYGTLLGALHLCVQPVTAPSPLARLCERLPHLSRQELVPALQSLRPVVDAVKQPSKRASVAMPPAEFKVSSLWSTPADDPVPTSSHGQAPLQPECGRHEAHALSDDIDWSDAPERIATRLADLAPTLFDGISGLAVGPTCACLRHSCIPNVQVEATWEPQGSGLRLTAIALRDIAADEELRIAYVATSAPARERQAALQAAGHELLCDCPKCILEKLPGEQDVAIARLPGDALHALAKQAQEEGNFSHAAQLLSALIKSHGSDDDPDAHHALGVCLLAQGDWTGAHRTWAIASRTWPQHPALRAQAAKDAAYWPAPHAPRLANSHAGVNDEHPGLAPAVNYIIPGIAALSSEPLLSAEDCAAAIEAAEAGALAGGGWTTQRHYAVPTTDVPVNSVPHLLSLFNAALERNIAAFVAAAFPHIVPFSSALRIHDAFLVRYDARGGGTQQRFLPVHVDESQVSLTIALNTGGGVDYTGGGTYFETAALAPDQRVVCPECGHVLAFRGDQRHGGEPIIHGVRYILAVFAFASV
jgi:SET domain